MRATLCAVVLLALSTLCGCTRGDSDGPHVNGALESEFRQVAAIDNHAHPMKVTAAGEADYDYDALPVEIIGDAALPTPLQGSPFFSNLIPAAQKALFAGEAKRSLQGSKGDSYPAFILNRTNTDIMLANRVAMGRGLPNDRFKWVPFVDMFLFPLNNAAAKRRDPDRSGFFDAETVLLKRFLAGAELRDMPASLDDYLTFVGHMLESWKAGGAVALKFELAYLRDLDVGNPPREVAERVYNAFANAAARTAEPSPDEYKALQDFLFRQIAGEAGRLNLPVHIHSSIGAGSYFRVANANPLALEGLLNDPSLRRTKFVLLHGAWPFAREAAALILKPNVYVDFSALAYLTYPREASHALRLYMEAAPQKVLYASDASPVSDTVGWEETAWLGAHQGREALTLALSDMVNDGELSVEQAKLLGRAVLRGNAHQLYGF